MKQPKSFTRSQKSIVAKAGFNPNEWMLVGVTRENLTIVNKTTQELENVPLGGK